MNKYPLNRCVQVRYSFPFIAQIAYVGHNPGYECIKGIPDDAEIVDAYVDKEKRIFTMVFCHANFAVVPEGQEPPIFMSEFIKNMA